MEKKLLKSIIPLREDFESQEEFEDAMRQYKKTLGRNMGYANFIRNKDEAKQQ